MPLEGCQVNNYKIVSQIGSGLYGLVFHVYDTATNFEFAMKVILKSSMNVSMANFSQAESDKRNAQLQHELSQFFFYNSDKLSIPQVDLQSIKDLTQEQLSCIPQYQEIWTQLQVHSHKNIVTIHQVLESSVATFLLMDYYHTDMFSAIVNQHMFQEDGALIKKVYLQVCAAVEHCHAQGIYHCDIKPENILLDKDNNAYICDFGLSTTQQHLSPNTNIGSTYYIAPEKILYCSEDTATALHSAKLPTDSGDVWSLGILLINMVCIRNPWLKAHQTEDRTFYHYVKDARVLQKILPLSDDLYQLLADVLQINPYQRMALGDVMAEVRTLRSFTKDGPLSEVDPYTLAAESETTNAPTTSHEMGETYYSYLAQKQGSPQDKEHGNDSDHEHSRDSNDKSPLYNCPKEINSCITLDTKGGEQDSGFKSGAGVAGGHDVNSGSFTGVMSSDATVCGSDNGDYPIIFEEDTAPALQDPATFKIGFNST